MWLPPKKQEQKRVSTILQNVGNREIAMESADTGWQSTRTLQNQDNRK